jgi:hypothetical protein
MPDGWETVRTGMGKDLVRKARPFWYHVFHLIIDLQLISLGIDNEDSGRRGESALPLSKATI